MSVDCYVFSSYFVGPFDLLFTHTFGDKRAGVLNSCDLTAQGGRDKLGWVRQLVRYTETHPILVVPPHGAGDVEIDGSGLRTTVFPALQPSVRREDVVLLQGWLSDTMQQLTSSLPANIRSQEVNLILTHECYSCSALSDPGRMIAWA